MKKLKIDFTKLSSLGVCYINKGRVVIKGRILFDMLLGYMKLKFNRLESYKLDEVAKNELGIGKVFVKDITKLWEEDWLLIGMFL